MNISKITAKKFLSTHQRLKMTNVHNGFYFPIKKCIAKSEMKSPIYVVKFYIIYNSEENKWVVFFDAR